VELLNLAKGVLDMTTKKEKDAAEFKAFQQWKASQEERKPGPVNEPTEKVKEFVQQERLKIRSKETVAMPREFIWIGAVIGGVLVLSSFPVVILGVVIGMGIIARVGCDWFKS